MTRTKKQTSRTARNAQNNQAKQTKHSTCTNVVGSSVIYNNNIPGAIVRDRRLPAAWISNHAGSHTSIGHQPRGSRKGRRSSSGLKTELKYFWLHNWPIYKKNRKPSLLYSFTGQYTFLSIIIGVCIVQCGDGTIPSRL